MVLQSTHAPLRVDARVGKDGVSWSTHGLLHRSGAEWKVHGRAWGSRIKGSVAPAQLIRGKARYTSE